MTILVTLESNAFDCSKLTLVRFRGREALSELFRFELELALDAGAEVPDGLEPNVEAAVVMHGDGGAERYFYGMVERIVRDRVPTSQREFLRLTLVPRVSRLLLVEQQQILMNMCVSEILRARLQELFTEVSDFVSQDLHGLGSFSKLEFVVQYQETDWAFLSRLVEHHGISYFFEHEANGDRIVFADDIVDFRTNEHASEVHFAENVGEPETLSSLRREDSVVSTHFVVYDQNYRRPGIGLMSESTIEGTGGAVLEYGTHLKTTEDAEWFAKIRAEERACRKTTFTGAGTVWQLRPGTRSTVVEQGRFERQELLIESVEHEFELAGFETAESNAHYSNRFTALTTEHDYRPLRRTPKPKIHGFLTGVVQGASEGAVSPLLDPDGRYFVQFHFDLLGDRASASRPCRMMQPFGGTTHGMHFPLRPGTEVAIGFADGDPDRPVILGALDNAAAPSPVTASNATMNRVVTQAGAVFEIGERR